MSDCKIEVIPFACATSTGNQAISLAGIGTPKGAFVVVTSATALDTQSADILLSIGATDGTRQRVCCPRVRDTLPSSDTYRWMKTTQTILLTSNSGTVEGEASFVSFTADTVTLNWTTAPASAFLGFVIVIIGADASVYVDTGNNSSGNQNVTAPNFEPSFVLDGSCRNSFDTGSADTIGTLSIGVATSSAQCSLNFYDDDAAAAAANVVMNTAAASMRNFSPSSLFGGWDITDFDSQGFSINQVSEAGTLGFYMAVKLDGCDVNLETGLATPTVTGTVDYTSFGKRPQFVLALSSWMQSSNWETRFVSLSGENYGMGIGARSKSQERGVAFSSQDAANDMVAKMQVADSAIFCQADDAADEYEAEVTFLPSGFRANWTQVPATPYRFAVLSVEDPAAESGVTMRRTTPEVAMVRS